MNTESLIDKLKAATEYAGLDPVVPLYTAIAIIRQHEADLRCGEISDNTYNAAVKELEYCSPGELGTKLAAVFRRSARRSQRNARTAAEPEKCPDCGADMMQVCSGLEDVCKREPVMVQPPIQGEWDAERNCPKGQVPINESKVEESDG